MHVSAVLHLKMNMTPCLLVIMLDAVGFLPGTVYVLAVIRNLALDLAILSAASGFIAGSADSIGYSKSGDCHERPMLTNSQFW